MPPSPHPTKLKLLHGETRPSRLKQGEPQPREALPQPPDWLTKEARTVWNHAVKELAAMGNAYAADEDALVVYCNAVVNHARAQQFIDLTGVMIKGTEDNVIKNPANTVAQHNALLIARFAREFGLTPSARVGLALGPQVPQDSRELAARLLS